MDLSHFMIILSLAVATGPAQMGYPMQQFLGLPNDTNNDTAGVLY
jgi:hypothetical protein